MQNFIVNTLIVTLSVLICAYVLPGVEVDGVGTAILVALALAFLNSFVKPILILLTIPATIFTLGLFLLVINALIILLADWLIDGFRLDGFWFALLFSFVLTIVKSLLSGLRNDKEKAERF
jgi:putative membrane protein